MDVILHGFHASAVACSRVQRNSVPSTQMEPGHLVGNLRVIEKGLRKDDRVIVGGMHAIPGQKVDAELGSAPAAN